MILPASIAVLAGQTTMTANLIYSPMLFSSMSIFGSNVPPKALQAEVETRPHCWQCVEPSESISTSQPNREHWLSCEVRAGDAGLSGGAPVRRYGGASHAIHDRAGAQGSGRGESSDM